MCFSFLLFVYYVKRKKETNIIRIEFDVIFTSLTNNQSEIEICLAYRQSISVEMLSFSVVILICSFSAHHLFDAILFSFRNVIVVCGCVCVCRTTAIFFLKRRAINKRLNISLRCVDIQQRGGKRLSICIFFLFRSTVVMVMRITRFGIIYSLLYIFSGKAGKEREKKKKKLFWYIWI